jgi:type IV secretory pathway TraG/TraD family ATPase VirD4
MPANANRDDKAITVFAETDFRNERKRFGIRRADRRNHVVVIGRTGMGKSTLLEQFIMQDIQHGEGFALLDPHGDLAQHVLRLIPKQRTDSLIYFDPADRNRPLGLNVLEVSDPETKHLVVSGIISAFKKIWAPDFWGPRMEHVFRYTILSLLDIQNATLADVPRMLTDKHFRTRVIESITSPQAKEFWLKEFEKYTSYFRQEVIAPILNKVGQFLAHALIRDIISQPQSAFDLRHVMDSGKIVIANLAKGKIGEDASVLLGAMLVTKFELAALSRIDVPEENRRDFYLYVDEFPSFATTNFSSLLSEARKYRLNLILVMQYVEQLEEPLRNALFENVGTIIAFRVGPESAKYLTKEFYPIIREEDLLNLPKFHIYLKLMIEGAASPPFSAVTLRPRSAISGATGMPTFAVRS